MNTTTLELDEENLQTAEDPEAPPEATVQADAANRDVRPDRQRVEQLAYSYWEERGCPYGSPEEDWLRAEQALRGE